jgi:hypothetical protein
MAEVAGRRLLIREAHIRIQVSACEICVGKSRTRTGFSLNLSVFPCHYLPTAAPYSVMCYWRWTELVSTETQLNPRATIEKAPLKRGECSGDCNIGRGNHNTFPLYLIEIQNGCTQVYIFDANLKLDILGRTSHTVFRTDSVCIKHLRGPHAARKPLVWHFCFYRSATEVLVFLNGAGVAKTV